LVAVRPVADLLGARRQAAAARQQPSSPIGTVGAMEPRTSLVTFGVADLALSKAFYEAMGWRGSEVEETVLIQAGSVALTLWGREKLAEDSGLDDTGTGTDGFGGVALTHNRGFTLADDGPLVLPDFDATPVPAA
jgi:catechol 2,3-dioxygenase-like lactoylglutathione lyase family enzyme